MLVKFTLPVGARLQGLRHIGNGVFVADTELPVGSGGLPRLIEVTVPEEDATIEVTTEPFDDPLADKALCRTVYFTRLP